MTFKESVGSPLFVSKLGNKVYRIALACLMFTGIASCSEAENSENATETHSQVPVPQYAQRDGNTYLYIGAITDEDQAQGKTAPVVAVRYIGAQGTTQRLEVVDDYGNRVLLFECEAPCRVAKQSSPDGTVSRLAIRPFSLLDAAFRDAFSGMLEPTTPPAPTPLQAAAEIAPPMEPAAARSPLTDWRGNRGRCRLTIDNGTYIDGDCWIRLEEDGSFQVMSVDERYFAQLSRSGDEALGYWNEAPGSTRAHAALGIMNRNGACWINMRAEICAWGD